MLKFLSGDWRSARSLLKTVLVGEPSVDETLRILDLLQKGKQARSTIRDGDALGRSAFGADWRGEKTDPKPLEDLVLWMRSLRGVSTEARQIASRLSNKAAVGTSAEQVQGILEEARRLTHALWLELSDKTQILFPGATGQKTHIYRKSLDWWMSSAKLSRKPRRSLSAIWQQQANVRKFSKC